MHKQELRSTYLEKRISLPDIEYTERNKKITTNFFSRINLEGIKVIHVFLHGLQPLSVAGRIAGERCDVRRRHAQQHSLRNRTQERKAESDQQVKDQQIHLCQLKPQQGRGQLPVRHRFRRQRIHADAIGQRLNGSVIVSRE